LVGLLQRLRALRPILLSFGAPFRALFGRSVCAGVLPFGASVFALKIGEVFHHHVRANGCDRGSMRRKG
jgi:hypothetical protein